MFVKICGTTTEEDALLAVAVGADAVGFVFAPSPRQVAPSRVADIVSRLPPEVLTVGVFRDETPERVVETVHRARLKAAQLHGHETASEVRWVAERVTTIKAFRAGDPLLGRAAEFGSPMILLDGPSPGSGRVFDWRLAEDVPAAARVILAGGLTPSNVAEAIATVRPWGVDVSSGVESAPGHKDPRKLRAFVAAAKLAATPAYHASREGPYDWQEEL
ncbi:MAG: phosphoribosylanthranilate isomerase [Actinomycetota bacterium]|nr:phosphoribosylanthranilate isomerase [Actinomycetota bacterium]